MGDAVDISKPLKKGTTRVENKEFETGTYTGDWMDGAPNGKGKHTFSDGDVYEGDFVGGMICGEGRMTYSNGDVYEGSWALGWRHKGTMTYADGTVIEGNWHKFHPKIHQFHPT